MLSENLLNDPGLSALKKKYFSNACLFNQGELGKSMFVIIEGSVSISCQKEGKEFLIGIPGPGEIIGERAILSTTPYRRHFTARAKSECTLIEVTAESIKTVLEKAPNFHLSILEMVLNRLDKANYLIRILQETDSVKRFIEYVLYFDTYYSKVFGTESKSGMSVPEIYQATVLSKELIKKCIEYCVKHKILTERVSGYTLEDPELLKSHEEPMRASLGL